MGTRVKQLRAERPGRANSDARKRREPRPEKPKRWFVTLLVRDVISRERYNLSAVIEADAEFEAGKKFRETLRATRRDIEVVKTVSVIRDDGRKAAWRNLLPLDTSDPDGPRAA